MNISMDKTVKQIDTVCDKEFVEVAECVMDRMSADMDKCERVEYADKATPEKSKMNVCVGTCERAKYEQKNDDNGESGMSADEGYSEPGETEQTSAPMRIGTPPESLT